MKRKDIEMRVTQIAQAEIGKKVLSKMDEKEDSRVSYPVYLRFLKALLQLLHSNFSDDEDICENFDRQDRHP